MSQPLAALWPAAKGALATAFPQFAELVPGGPLVLELGSDGWVLEVTPDGQVLCQYGMAMEDAMNLMSEGTPEDLGTDEVAKQAKYFIQQGVSKFRRLLVESGFTESTEMNDAFVAVTFARGVDFQNLAKVEDLIRWCCRTIGNMA